jgi:hypothetical protein
MTPPIPQAHHIRNSQDNHEQQPVSQQQGQHHGGAGAHAQGEEAGASIVLEEEIDPDYEPTSDEVIEYAKWLGMDLAEDQELLWIAKEGLKAPLPENWKPCKTSPENGEICTSSLPSFPIYMSPPNTFHRYPLDVCMIS